MSDPLRHLDLFSGIGGFALAFQRAGFETVGFCEKDAQCRKLLASKFPGIPISDDITTFQPEPYCAEIVTGGFPCQDLSIAGKRAGLAGNRSGLFYQMMRIVRHVQPSFVLWENVPGLFSSGRGLDFAAVLDTLDDLGYHGAWRVLDAQYFGVPQRRRRVFGLFASGHIGAGRCAEILSVAARMSVYSEAGAAQREASAETLRPRASRDSTTIPEDCGNLISGTLTENYSRGGDNGLFRRPMVTAPTLQANQRRPTLDTAMADTPVGGVRRLTPRECERLQGFPDDWTAGFSDTCRYRMLGNAIAVPVVEWIARRLATHSGPAALAGESSKEK